MERYDLIVVGSGPGGYVAAERAGAMGKKVLLIEKENLGGVCTNRGCIPTKSLLKSAKIYRNALDGGKHGVVCPSPSFDMKEAQKWKREAVETLRSGIAFLMKANNVTVLSGKAEFIDEHTVRVGEDLYSCSFMIIATGSSPVRPPIEGADGENVLTSDTVLALESIPSSIAVIGGGVIGIEFASFFSMIGTKVTVIEMTREILPMMDDDMAEAVRKAIEDVTFHLSSRVTRIEKDGVVFISSDGKEEKAEASLVLLAAGRRPNTEGLERLGLFIESGAVVVDSTMRTNVSSVYAIGDVNNISQLAHSASRMAEVAVDNIFGSARQRMRTSAVPWAVYSEPEAAGCGITEREAGKRGIEVITSSVQMRGNGRFIAENGKRVFGSVKVIASKETGTILGVHILAPYASEIICSASTLIEAELRVQDMVEVIFPHPSVSEAIRDCCYEIYREMCERKI